MLAKRTTADAVSVWKYLNGLINVYKPSGISVNQVKSAIITNLCKDLNELNVRDPQEIVKINNIEIDTETKYLVSKEKNYADDVRVIGARYQHEDIRCAPSSHLGKFSSGVLLLGINGGLKYCKPLRENKSIKVYHVIGKFGRSTESHFSDSPVTSRASYGHVYSDKINSFLASLQASHQKKMFDLCAVDIQSQAAYELAVQGPIRPAQSNIPVLYGIRCIDFKKPFFTMEIHAVNESEAYLGILVHEIGLGLKSVAHCTQIRCIRNSYFTVENSLVRQQWNLQNILNSMSHCNQLLKKHPEVLKQTNVQLSTVTE